ncbi:putative secreted protein [Pseudonocardia sp. Ae168_Ps1]|uniref:class F sortase n=1 Tax=unclassified Pseudonocardia TaxID=2619320 RepID=UPI00094AF4C5|nr:MULTISPECIES: class F sortase [unclassified Pseudonocardia]OLL75857.1 putative secreted protein [Pseudonocardia sp. Ae150A_Ps1]OLL81855.1 putative secreted protein [Pseudonocardia sp. Ae168_Ps1]OLL84033.1 putative secreted protein [Pseudonocardia sp. Ae263_Ps1]OLL95948.1 putative secreted protein [Pseudonocardia sp. Ae356_Ps1]
MTARHRHPRGGVRGAAALLLSGVALLGAGAGLALGDDPRIVAEDLGSVPAPMSGGVRAVPASEALPVLARPDPVVGAPDVADLPGSPPPAPATPSDPAVPPAPAAQGTPAAPAAPTVPLGPDPAAARPAPPAPAAALSPDVPAGPGNPAAPAGDPARPLPGPGVPAAETPRRAGPPAIAAQQPWTVSPIYPPTGPGPGERPSPVVPATLELPARGVTAPVDAVGTGPNGGMVVPEEVRTVGWWAPGVLPGGAAGSSVIAGHVDSRTQGVGVLAVLPQLTAGEPVVVRGADGRAATFRVAARREYGKHDLPRDVFRRDGSPQLVLVTCGGVFDPATGSYESNIVVYAVPEPL